jgi:hypothetical protein
VFVVHKLELLPAPVDPRHPEDHFSYAPADNSAFKGKQFFYFERHAQLHFAILKFGGMVLENHAFDGNRPPVSSRYRIPDPSGHFVVAQIWGSTGS